MITLKSIKVEQAEGKHKQFVRGTANSVEEANSLLRLIAQSGPDLGYYKTDVLVAWADGVEVKLRHDVKHYSAENNDTNVTSQLQGWARFIKRTAVSWGQPASAILIADEILAEKRAVI